MQRPETLEFGHGNRVADDDAEMAALLRKHFVGQPQHLDVKLDAQRLADSVDAVEELRQTPFDEDRNDLPLRGVGLFQEADFPLGVGHLAAVGARAETRGKGQDRQIAEELFVELPGVGGALRAVLVHRNPQRAQRFEVHQQVVDHHPRVAETVDQLVGEHHADHAPERMVRGEEVTASGGELVESFDRIGDLPFAETGADELLRRQRPVVFEDMVDFRLVDRAAQPVHDRTGNPASQPRGFLPEYGADVDFGHGMFGKLYPQIYGFFAIRCTLLKVNRR